VSSATKKLPHLAVTLAALLVLLGAADAAAPKARGTERVVFFPFRGSLLAPGIIIARQVRGSCLSGSEVVRRWDAWSCSANRRSFDPCFSGRRTGVGAFVACMTSPWSGATLLELRHALPHALANVVGDPRRHAPWALTLAKGEHCALAHGLGLLAGQQINYACAGSAVLTGLPDRRRAIWTIRRAATRSSPLRLARVRRAWW
jgi:hypothetical protein